MKHINSENMFFIPHDNKFFSFLELFAYEDHRKPTAKFRLGITTLKSRQKDIGYSCPKNRKMRNEKHKI
jgi:hypothetical protein